MVSRQGTWSFPPFSLDLASERLLRGSENVSLHPKAFAVLKHLVGRAGDLVTKEELLASVWGDVNVADSVLKVCVGEVRKALEDDAHAPQFIETAHGRGYRFIAPAQKSSALPSDRLPATQYASSGDLKIAYQIHGTGPVDLVFIMGWVSHLEYFWTEPTFASFLQRLASFSRLILFDKRGTGLSDSVPVAALPTLEQRMDDLHAVMEAAGSERAVICGVSEGGPMSALFAATYPEKTEALVMIGTYANRIREESYPWGPTAEEHELFLQHVKSHWGGPVGLEERAPSMAGDPRFREWWSTYLRMACSPSAAVALTRMNSEIDVRDILPTVRVPTLVLHRKQDVCLQVEEGRYVASLIPGACFVELPGRDHLPFVGDQESVLKEIESFITGSRQRRDSDRILATMLAMETCPVNADPRVRAFVDQQIHWFQGRRVQFEPGRLLASFDGPARAIRCAWAITNRLESLTTGTRAGLHSGECKVTDESVTGFAVDLAKQICNRAGSGEVLVSGTVRDLVAGSGIQFREAGDLAVAGSERTWGLFSAVPEPEV